jgi:hypothetical protein
VDPGQAARCGLQWLPRILLTLGNPLLGSDKYLHTVIVCRGTWHGITYNITYHIISGHSCGRVVTVTPDGLEGTCEYLCYGVDCV